jgi:methyl-accepting chemotaxis protein
MKWLMSPVVSLMQRLRLLPKFSLIAVLFIAPLLLVTFLLFSELQKSIQSAEQERIGAHYASRITNAIRIAQRHRTLRHMQISGNAAAGEPATQTFDTLQQAMSTLDASETVVARFDAGETWEAVRQEWAKLQSNRSTTNAGDSYAIHNALINRMGKLKALVADRSGLTLDPETGSNQLSAALINILPEISEDLSHITGKGAAYIDTGLLEANEDVVLNSRVMVTRRDLQHLPARFEAVWREAPELQGRLEPQLIAVTASLAFLDRARDEVLMAYNQGTGLAFFEAGSKSIDGLHAMSAASSEALDMLLAARIERASRHRAVVGAVVIAALGLAAWLLAGFYLSFSREIGKLEQAVERAAAGDLSDRIASQAHDEIGRLVNAFGGMNAGLAQLVAQVRAGSVAVTSTSQDIATDNADLSSRTESQASALEETASSMEQLTATVKQNSDNATEANRLAMAAADVAAQGSVTVGQAIDTMEAIKTSSRKIIDIVAVIDGIAFQTNMLALNAAVEAARAGEHGRGFAVVAGEVRALAQRSALAAKEVKLLIESSVDGIDNGNQLVNAAGKTMGGVVSAVRRVADLINDIASASREQAAGITQVNQSIIQMEEVTQRNAALVEHGANAAASLHAQALGLQRAASAFNLGDSDAETDAALAPVAIVKPLPASSRRREPLMPARLEMKKTA